MLNSDDWRLVVGRPVTQDLLRKIKNIDGVGDALPESDGLVTVVPRHPQVDYETIRTRVRMILQNSTERSCEVA